MKLFFQLQWQQSRFVWLFLAVTSCILFFTISYDKLQPLHILIFTCNVSLSIMFAPNRIIESRGMLEQLRTLPITNETVSKYFIYSQLFSIIVLFIMSAPHLFYAAYVQQKWTSFTLAFCFAFCFCLIVHALLLPSRMRKMKELSLISGFALTLPVLIGCFFIGAFIFGFFNSYAIVISIIVTLLVFVLYMRRIQKYIHIRIYEHIDI